MMKHRYNSRSVRFAYLLLLLLLAVENFALDPNAALDKYIHRKWTVKDGLPHDSVTCFAQDWKGFIWIGTSKGLARFDGNDFKIFNVSNTRALKGMDFTALRGFQENQDQKIVFTGLRMPIKEFNSLAMPDRSLIDLRNYKNKIGMASVTDCISIQTTRGCPFECLFCHFFCFFIITFSRRKNG